MSVNTAELNGDDAALKDRDSGAGLEPLSPEALERLRNFSPPNKAVQVCKALAVFGALVFVCGAMFNAERAWSGMLLVGNYLVGLALAGLLFIALQYVSGAGWSVALRRIPEAMTTLLPAGVGAIALVLVFYSTLYGDETFTGFKGLWLGRGFSLVRTVLYIAIWLYFIRAILQHSREQDADGAPIHTRHNVRLSAIFIVLFALTYWLASVDWIMSLEPHWYSTIFGIYNFSGLFTSGLACIILLAAWLRHQGCLRGLVTDDQFHDLGKLLLAFTTFWAYIWFSQYMLIWYANIPEETVYFITRTRGVWGSLFIINFALNWVLPFFVLLPRENKRNTGIMVKVAIVVLVGRWLDLYLMIFPATDQASPVFGIWEIGITAGAGGLFGLLIFRALRQAPLIPLKDPHLHESLHHHQ